MATSSSSAPSHHNHNGDINITNSNPINQIPTRAKGSGS